MDEQAIAHCLAAIRRISAIEDPSRRELFQLGYNLGRLSELASLGRGPCWDEWKEAVAHWDRAGLAARADRLDRTWNSQPDS